MSLLPCSFWNLKSIGGDSNQVDTLANKELQIVQSILGKWMSLLRHGSLRQGPGNSGCVCPYNSYCLLARSHVIHVLLSNPSKDVGRLPFYAYFPVWVTEFSSQFSKRSRVDVCCHCHWDSDGGFGGMAHVTPQDPPLDIPGLRICIVNEPPR